LQKRDSDCRWFYAPIRGAKALLNGEAGDLAGFRIHSAAEFTIELDEPLSFFPALISYVGASIVPEGDDSFAGGRQEGCVGTGPFRVVKFDPGRRLELERNKTYWRKGYPRSEELIFSLGVLPANILSGFAPASSRLLRICCRPMLKHCGASRLRFSYRKRRADDLCRL
jgi:ABC-type oligopeptide transport system substrate-binding subunit